MGEALEIRTGHRDVSAIVKELAPHVDDVSIRLPADRSIADGEWVSFSVALADGTIVFEGLGRAQGSTNGRIALSLLQFDDRNEIMYERVLLARDDAEGVPTGTIDLNQIASRELELRDSPPALPARPRPSPPSTPRSSPASSAPSKPSSVPSQRPPPLPNAPRADAEAERRRAAREEAARAARMRRSKSEWPSKRASEMPRRAPASAKPPASQAKPPTSQAKPPTSQAKPPASPTKPPALPPEPKRSAPARPSPPSPPPKERSEPAPARPAPTRPAEQASRPQEQAERGSAAQAPPSQAPPSQAPAAEAPLSKPAVAEAAPSQPTPAETPASPPPPQALTPASESSLPPPRASAASAALPAPAALPAGDALLHLPAAPDANWSAGGETVTESARESAQRGARARVSVPIEGAVPVSPIATLDTVVSRPGDRHEISGPIRLTVSAGLVARARTLGPNLPKGVLPSKAKTRIEEKVLRAALQIGLASLAALADVEDDDG